MQITNEEKLSFIVGGNPNDADTLEDHSEGFCKVKHDPAIALVSIYPTGLENYVPMKTSM